MAARMREVSVRRMKPTWHEIDVMSVQDTINNWKPEFEQDGIVNVYDDDSIQYLLCDHQSHLIFYAALVLKKPSLRCTIVSDQPDDLMETTYNNRFELKNYHNYNNNNTEATEDYEETVQSLMATLRKRGFKFL